MGLQQKVMEDMKAAMRAKDAVALEALRAIKSAILLARTESSSKELSEKDELRCTTARKATPRQCSNFQ